MTVTFKGAPCRHGHDGTRYIANRKCVACALAEQVARYDRAEATAKKRAYRARLKEAAMRDMLDAPTPLLATVCDAIGAFALVFVLPLGLSFLSLIY